MTTPLHFLVSFLLVSPPTSLHYNLTVYVSTVCSGQGVGPVASAATVMARLLHLLHLLPSDPV